MFHVEKVESYCRRVSVGVRGMRLELIHWEIRRLEPAVYEIRQQQGRLVEKWEVVNELEMIQLWPPPDPLPDPVCALIRRGRAA